MISKNSNSTASRSSLLLFRLAELLTPTDSRDTGAVSRGIPHNVSLDFSRHEHEGRLNVFALFGGRLHEANIVVIGHLLAFLVGDGPAILLVTLIAEENAAHIALRV